MTFPSFLPEASPTGPGRWRIFHSVAELSGALDGLLLPSLASRCRSSALGCGRPGFSRGLPLPGDTGEGEPLGRLRPRVPPNPLGGALCSVCLSHLVPRTSRF